MKHTEDRGYGGGGAPHCLVVSPALHAKFKAQAKVYAGNTTEKPK